MAKKKAAQGSVVDPKYTKPGHYKVSKIKTAGGKRYAMDVDDAVAKELRGKDMAELRKVAREHGVLKEFDERWSKLNVGLCRMAMGNRLRGLRKPKKAAKKKVA